MLKFILKRLLPALVGNSVLDIDTLDKGEGSGVKPGRYARIRIDIFNRTFLDKLVPVDESVNIDFRIGF